MAAVARKVAPKKKKSSTAKKPVARQSSTPQVALVAPAKAARPAGLAKGRAASKARSPKPVATAKVVKAEEVEKASVGKLKAQAAPKKTTKPRKKKSTTAKTKPQKTEQATLPLFVTPSPSRAKLKVADSTIKTPQKRKKRKRKTTRKRPLEVTATPKVSPLVSPKKPAAPARKRAQSKTNNSVTKQPLAKQQAVAPKRVIRADSKAMSITVKARRVRAPKDLAAQYGESENKSTKRRSGDSAESKRARRDAALRQKMRDAMEVGDDLIARLRRAGMIAGEEQPEAKNGHSPRRIPGSRIMRRPRKWEARCGKCGGKSLFKTPAGLCARCGAIMVRE